jgi:NAD(P)-dependent dehydrogenase (short-subunit alcohol dehydrogenase family)
MAATRPRTALVTGAAARIGRAIALDLADAGWAVAVHYRGSATAAEAVVDAIAAAGGRAAALGANLADEAATDALVERATEALGPVGCLVNNASAFDDDRIDTMTRASWDRHMEVNLRAPAVLTQAMAEALPTDATGCIVNLVDQRVLNLTPYFLSYTLSKAALWTLTRTTALALAPRIRVNAIGPGPVLPSARQSRAQFDDQVARLPLGRGATPEDIARTVRYIVSMEAMTGQLITLDGGQHLGWAQPGEPSPPVE